MLSRTTTERVGVIGYSMEPMACWRRRRLVVPRRAGCRALVAALTDHTTAAENLDRA